MLSLLHYLSTAITNPDANRLGFPAMGLGIDQRRHRLARHWSVHLQRCKALQAEWIQQCFTLNDSEQKQESVSVLGAGRLFDVDLKTLSKQFKDIALVDADPLCRAYWKRAQVGISRSTNVFDNVVELSGVLTEWQKAFRRQLTGDWQSDLKLLRYWNCELDLPLINFSKFLPKTKSLNGIISLNLLSQIPIVWQDCVERILRKRYGSKHLRETEPDWINAFSHSARQLIEQHLCSLNHTAAESILLISDLEYAYYQTELRYSRRNYEAEPLIYEKNNDSSSEQNWKSNLELAKRHSLASSINQCEILPALYGINLESPREIEQWLPNYQLVKADSWLWHIQPLGAEPCSTRPNEKVGTVHRVGGFQFIKRKDCDFQVVKKTHRFQQ